jgi:predicted AlkP superfamily pyrophosphatase or phosphodiesterase
MSKVILIVIDGCRPDALQEADTPAIDGLLARGAATMQACTVQPSITLPAHFSLFTSLLPHDHNVTTNTGSPQPSATARGLMELIKYNRLSTAAAYSWEPLRNLSPPCALDAALFLNTEKTAFTDIDIMRAAVRMVTELQPDFCFIYLEGVDQAGHAGGWMSDIYLEAVRTADRAVGRLLETLAASRLDQKTTVILQSDHGGDGNHHRQPVDAVLNIPWIVCGPAIRPAHRIQAAVTILDTAPTVARLLGIRPHYTWQGQVPEEIFVEQA